MERHLRRSLEVLRDRADDPALRRRMDEVLAGRASLRDLARDDGFDAMMTPLVERGMHDLDELSPEERARAEAGAAALERGEDPWAPEDEAGADRAPYRPPGPGTW
ncbi:hypothetical protein [Phycicoccus avicenniae]|uniref:hypothetical protein n=1 Tax=Phycicoccus avicenniae TaxID=2828860 RepID=UPI003D2A450F